METENDVIPLLCKPLLKSKIWGGRWLESLYGIPLPEGENIGEAWLAADLREGASTIAGGPRDGQTLAEVTREWGERMIGSAWRNKPTGGRFPLLIKLLDAQDDLSIQVHPSEADCRRAFPDDFSKDESWIVVDAQPGGRILHGFRPGATLEQFDALNAQGRVVECLRAIEAAPGQVYRVAPGTVHALCQGVAILEIQEPSDSTFRVYDYERPGDDGKLRPVHVEAARQVMVFGDDAPAEIIPKITKTDWGVHELLVDSPAYRIERPRVRRTLAWRVDPRSAQALIALEGRLELRAAGQSLELGAGACAILPAAVGDVQIEPAEEALCVLAGAGGIEMIAPGRG